MSFVPAEAVESLLAVKAAGTILPAEVEGCSADGITSELPAIGAERGIAKEAVGKSCRLPHAFVDFPLRPPSKARDDSW